MSLYTNTLGQYHNKHNFVPGYLQGTDNSSSPAVQTLPLVVLQIIRICMYMYIFFQNNK